jgi:hypothetical protein
MKYLLDVNSERLTRYISFTAPGTKPEEVLEKILKGAGIVSATVTEYPEPPVVLPAHTCVDQPNLVCPACSASFHNR